MATDSQRRRRRVRRAHRFYHYPFVYGDPNSYRASTRWKVLLLAAIYIILGVALTWAGLLILWVAFAEPGQQPRAIILGLTTVSVVGASLWVMTTHPLHEPDPHLKPRATIGKLP